MKGENYANTYQHFDNLIWQLPGWSTGIYILTFTGLSFISKTDFSLLNIDIDKYIITRVFLIICILFQFTIYNALVRFRVHQLQFNPKTKLFRLWAISGQFWLQNVTIFQLSSLLFLLILNWSDMNVAIIWFFISIVVLLFYSLFSIYYSRKKSG